MKKFLVILIVTTILLLGVAGVGYVYLKESNKTVIRDTLSERSKEFIASQKKDENLAWQSVDLEKKRAGESDFDSNRVTVKACYSIIVPFQVTTSRQNDPCVYYALIDSPRGNMNASLRDVGFRRVDDAPDVTFRRGKSAEYREERVRVNDIDYIIFTNTQSGTEKTAFGMLPVASDDGTGKLFTLNFSLNAPQDVQVRQMKKILESLRLETAK